MRDIMYFSADVAAKFDNKNENLLKFNEVMLDTANGVHTTYSKEDANAMIREQFNQVLGINFKEATDKERRQALRRNRVEVAQLMEDVLIDKQNSGWNEANAKFMQFVDQKNIGQGDQNEFVVKDNSLLVVSKFAGDHHDIVRQALRPDTSFRVATSNYVIKVYADYKLFMLGRIDFAEFADRCYRSIDQNRYAALFKAFMSMDKNLGEVSGLTGTIAVSTATIPDMVEVVEAVKAATGRDVILVGTRPAIQKLQSTVSYNMYSSEMKNEQNQRGVLANWEGYECLALDRVNEINSTQSVFDDAANSKIYVLPVDPDFKPIKHVISGDMEYVEAGMDGTTFDQTATIDIRYEEGIGVVINQLFGMITLGQ